MKTVINILLFLYGVSIGVPDVALDFYSTRLRLDDGIIFVLFLCVLINGLHQPYRFTKSQLKFLRLMGFFALFCLSSFCVTFLGGVLLDFYSLLRMLGCLLVLATVPTLLKSPERIVCFGLGLLFCGCILILQIILTWYGKATEIALATYSFRLKNALSFKTWNPNTSASYAIMFALVMALVSYEISGVKKGIFWGAAGVFSLIPFVTFARAAAAGIGAAWLAFILLARKNRPAKMVIALLFVGMLTCLAIYEWELIRSAVRINLSTGEGLSDHHVMWRRALGLIAESPLLGYGFGRELLLYKAKFGGGMAQNAFLSVCVEGGLVGLLLFAWPLAYLARCFWRSTHGALYDTRAVICFGFLLGILILGITHSALYWHKSQMLILSLMLVYMGKVESSLSSAVGIQAPAER